VKTSEQGALLIFASGPEEARPRVAPVFDAIGQRTLWLGPAGYGSRMKLVNKHPPRLHRRRGGQFLWSGPAPRTCDVFGGGRVRRSPLVSSWESAKFRRITERNFLVRRNDLLSVLWLGV
jgi:3-hydroxyisobutyrate dehydrogenase